MTSETQTAEMSATDQIENFLDGRRLGILTTASFPGLYPIPRPVWFEWDNGTAYMFSSSVAPKIKRLSKDPLATLLVANEVAEPEFWVAIQGEIEIDSNDVLATVERLATRYWGDDPTEAEQGMLSFWRKHAEHLVNIRLRMDKISSGGG